MSDGREIKPTTKRRQEARREGRVAASSSLVGGTCWLSLVALASLCGAQWIVAGKQAVMLFWSQPIQVWTVESRSEVQGAMVHFAMASGALLGFLFASAVLGRLAQVGFLWAPHRILPQSERLNPSARFTELFSLDRLVLGVRAMSIFVILVGVLIASLWIGQMSILQLTLASNIGNAVFQLFLRCGLHIGICLFVVGLLDYAYQRYRFEQSLRMTPEEIRAEVQAVQKNPQIGTGRHGLRQKLKLSDVHTQNVQNSRASAD